MRKKYISKIYNCCFKHLDTSILKEGQFTNNENQNYEFFCNKDGVKEEPFASIIGHENQKKEILAVIDWFKHSKELKERGVSNAQFTEDLKTQIKIILT